MLGSLNMSSPAIGSPVSGSAGARQSAIFGDRSVSQRRSSWRPCRMREGCRWSVVNSAAKGSAVDSVTADVAKEVLVMIFVPCY